MKTVAARVGLPLRSRGNVARARLGATEAGLVLAAEFAPGDVSTITRALALPAGSRPTLVAVDLWRRRVVVAPHVGPRETRVALTGELDLASAPMLDWALSFALYRQPGRVVLDLRRLVLIDARCAQAVAAAAARMGDWDGTLVGLGPRPPVRRVFEICGLSDLIDRGVPPPAPMHLLQEMVR